MQKKHQNFIANKNMISEFNKFAIVVPILDKIWQKIKMPKTEKNSPKIHF